MSIQPRSNKLFILPVVKVDQGLSVSAEVMCQIWHQICHEGKKELLFYDGGITSLKEWIDYIYHPGNYVALVVDDAGHVYHIAWINKFDNKCGFLHHCALGSYNRHTWPTLKKYWQDMKDSQGEPLIYTLMGVTPVTNEKAVKLVKMLGWSVIGRIPAICYMAYENRYVDGVISYTVINEVSYGRR
jgi:hypothetical protein